MSPPLPGALQKHTGPVPTCSPECLDLRKTSINRAVVRLPNDIAFVFREGKWTSRESRSSLQPYDGFTVAAFESEQQTRMLRLAYEETDREGRELIRRFAAASLE